MSFARLKGLSLAALCTLGACATTVNPVVFTREFAAPTLASRADNCPVDVVEEGNAFDRPHKLLGHVVLEWSATQMKEQGPEYAYKTLKAAACEQGGHAVINLRGLPRGFNEGMIYEGDIVALLDEHGEVLTGKATGTAASHEGTSTSSPPSSPPSSP